MNPTKANLRHALLLMSITLVAAMLWPHALLAQSDEARELYERAQELLREERYSRAARAFEDVFDEYEGDDLAGEAMYWYAFALYRMGDRGDLRDARGALEIALEKYEEAVDRSETMKLLERIEGKLARLGDAGAARRVHERTEDDADEELRMSALNALIHMDSERALPIIQKILENPDKYSGEMRAQAIFLLAQHGGDEVEDLMMDVAKNDQDDEVREQAIFWLSQVGSDRALDLLFELFQSDIDNEDIQERLIFAIAQHGDERSAKLLRDIAGDRGRDSEIRENAIFWLGQQDDDNFPFLRDLFLDAEDSEVKEKIIFAVSQQNGREQAEFLTQVLRDENEDTEIRKNALFWLGQSGRLDLTDLEGMYATLEDREMREQAIFVIAQQGGSQAVDLLMEIVRSEEDPDLKSNAVFWIGQIDDDRAVELLEEIIDGGGR